MQFAFELSGSLSLLRLPKLVHANYRAYFVSFTGTLSVDASHFAIPDTACLCDYLEVFEQAGITGCILLESSLAQVPKKLA